ncbi:unnamed protein product, partial [Prorocentrum cordatum]
SARVLASASRPRRRQPAMKKKRGLAEGAAADEGKPTAKKAVAAAEGEPLVKKAAKRKASLGDAASTAGHGTPAQDGAAAAAAAAPNKKKKGAAVLEADKADLIKQAIEEIRTGITAPGAQEKGKAFVPKNWAARYREALGSFKAFLKSQPSEFLVVEDGQGDFTVRAASDAEPVPVPKEMPWATQLHKAWLAYCKAVPRPLRDFRGGFLAAVPGGGRPASAGGGGEEREPEGPPPKKSRGLPFTPRAKVGAGRVMTRASRRIADASMLR